MGQLMLVGFVIKDYLYIQWAWGPPTNFIRGTCFNKATDCLIVGGWFIDE